jgi:hypothetical protein
MKAREGFGITLSARAESCGRKDKLKADCREDWDADRARRLSAKAVSLLPESSVASPLLASRCQTRRTSSSQGK